MKTIDTKCACGAAPGEKCRDLGYGDERRGPTGFHISRVNGARLITAIEARERNAKKRDYRASKEKTP